MTEENLIFENKMRILEEEICLLLFLHLWTTNVRSNGLENEEPFCTSRFDYDYKMLKKLLTLEMEYDKLKMELRESTNDMQKIEEKLKDETEKRIEIENKFRKIENSISLDKTGATYVRWGRTTCPGNGTEMVYKGYAAGSHYTTAGAAANYLCLPEEPLWNVYQDGQQSGHGIYGVEYEFKNRETKRFFGKLLADREAPCCVCQTKLSAVLMVPGRNQCYDGWALEYQGYLVADHETHTATEFVCLDADAEPMSGGEDDVNGRLFYMSEARCGALRCPPYVQGRELTCVVCSK